MERSDNEDNNSPARDDDFAPQDSPSRNPAPTAPFMNMTAASGLLNNMPAPLGVPYTNPPNMPAALAMQQFFQSMMMSYCYANQGGLPMQYPTEAPGPTNQNFQRSSAGFGGGQPGPIESSGPLSQHLRSRNSMDGSLAGSQDPKKGCGWLKVSHRPSLGDDEDEESTPPRKRGRGQMRLAVAKFFAQNQKRGSLASNTESPSTPALNGILSDSDEDAPPPQRATNQVARPLRAARPRPRPQTRQQRVEKVEDKPSTSCPLNPTEPLRCRRCKVHKPNGLLKCSHAFCLFCIKEMFQHTKPCPRCPKGKHAFRQWETLYV